MLNEADVHGGGEVERVPLLAVEAEMRDDVLHPAGPVGHGRMRGDDAVEVALQGLAVALPALEGGARGVVHEPDEVGRREKVRRLLLESHGSAAAGLVQPLGQPDLLPEDLGDFLHVSVLSEQKGVAACARVGLLLLHHREWPKHAPVRKIGDGVGENGVEVERGLAARGSKRDVADLLARRCRRRAFKLRIAPAAAEEGIRLRELLRELGGADELGQGEPTLMLLLLLGAVEDVVARCGRGVVPLRRADVELTALALALLQWAAERSLVVVEEPGACIVAIRMVVVWVCGGGWSTCSRAVLT